MYRLLTIAGPPNRVMRRDRVVTLRSNLTLGWKFDHRATFCGFLRVLGKKKTKLSTSTHSPPYTLSCTHSVTAGNAQPAVPTGNRSRLYEKLRLAVFRSTLMN
jgi:hypothetical protein